MEGEPTAKGGNHLLPRIATTVLFLTAVWRSQDTHFTTSWFRYMIPQRMCISHRFCAVDSMQLTGGNSEQQCNYAASPEMTLEIYRRQDPSFGSYWAVSQADEFKAAVAA